MDSSTTNGPQPLTDARGDASRPSLAVDDDPRLLSWLLDQTGQPFVMFDKERRFRRVNQALADLTGYSVEELLGMSVSDLTHEDSVQITDERLQRLAETGQPQRYSKKYVRKDGRVVPVEVVAATYRDECGVILGFSAFITDIAERNRAEHAIRESEARFRRLYDEAPFGYDELDCEGRLVSVNGTECDLLGYTRPELLGRAIADFVDAPEQEETRLSIAEMVREVRPPHPTERTFVTKDGRKLIAAIENRLRRDADGTILGLRRTLRDVTTRRATETALVASERRARALFEGIEDGIFVHDLAGQILDVNPAVCRHLGYTREELLQLSTRDIDDPEFASGYEGRLERQLQQGRLSFEGRHHTKDGRLIPVEISTSTILFEGQRAVLAVMRDISERKALEQARRRFDEAQLQNARKIEEKHRALTQSEARYRQLTEGCHDAVVVADDRGLITLFNPAAGRTFGYEAGEVIGQPITVLMPAEFHGPHNAGFERYLRTRDPRVVGRTVELRGRRKDGTEFPMELSLSAVEVAGATQFIGSIRDQAERQRMRAMLAQSEKLASIGLLSAGVAHEINNPLAYIGNNLAVLERDLKGIRAMMDAYEATHDALAVAAPDALGTIKDLSEEVDWPYVRENLGRLLSRTREGVQRVANIVQNLRGLARTGAPKMEDVALGDLLASALEMIQGRLRRSGVEQAIDVPQGLPKVHCVGSQISQVLLNLLVNAVQAIEEAERPEGGRLRVTIRQQDEHQAVEIRDNGSGIDPENIPRLFDPFFTTKPVGEGTGLGLSISHGIVTGHGGRIDVESRLGEGTCFRVLLPRVAPETGAAGNTVPHPDRLEGDR